jgi:hypothetical protein
LHPTVLKFDLWQICCATIEGIRTHIIYILSKCQWIPKGYRPVLNINLIYKSQHSTQQYLLLYCMNVSKWFFKFVSSWYSGWPSHIVCTFSILIYQWIGICLSNVYGQFTASVLLKQILLCSLLNVSVMILWIGRQVWCTNNFCVNIIQENGHMDRSCWKTTRTR